MTVENALLQRTSIHLLKTRPGSAKPMAAYSMMGSRIPSEVQLFWQLFSFEEPHSLYMAINATPGKVLALFQELIITLDSDAE